MAIGLRRPWNAVDFDDLARLFPPPPEYFEREWFVGPEEIERLKLSRSRDRADRAYRVPFFRRLWDANGFDPRDLRSPDDMAHVPTYAVDDLRLNIEERPPFGDYQGVSASGCATGAAAHPHVGRHHWGAPPTLYTQWDRGVSGVLNGRGMYMQGLRPGDVVINSWAYGLHNGALCFDETLQRWMNCLVITASTGTVTSTATQLDLARRFGAAAILTTGDHLLRIAQEARSLGLDPKRDLSIRALATKVGNEGLHPATGPPSWSTSSGARAVARWCSAPTSRPSGIATPLPSWGPSD